MRKTGDSENKDRREKRNIEIEVRRDIERKDIEDI